MEQVISDIILTAEKEIFLSCYVFTYVPFADMLCDAVMERGINVDVYIGNAPQQLEDSAVILNQLERGGVRFIGFLIQIIRRSSLLIILTV